VRVTRGPEDSMFNKPAQQLEAEGIISRNQQTETDVRWLQAKAQAAILEHRPDAAIANLSRALEQQHGSSSATVKLSLAIAYVERGDSTRDRANYAQAIDLLNWIVRQKPSNHVAMFDLALTYTKMEMWDQAAAAWTNYLQSDAEGGWAHEARIKLQQVNANLNH
jgi:tetratricopeptide (TPR) repeat protein